MAMAKREFAARLLFWLLPWPISKALPRALRIYYFGPGAEPPGGWYYYWGKPGFYWPDPDVPPDPYLFPNLPYDIFNPGDPINPTPPDEWPDLPPGPVNPVDPYFPGPGPGYTYPQPGKGDVFFNEDYWTPADANTTWVAGHWHCVFPGVGPSTILNVNGLWNVNYRPSWFHISFTESTLNDINIALRDDSVMENEIAAGNNIEHDLYLPITFLADDIGSIFIEQTDVGLNPININLIEFL